MPTSLRRRRLSRMPSACLYRIDLDPRLGAVDEFDPGGFERPVHISKRALVGRSRVAFEIRNRFRRNLAGGRQFALGPPEQSASCPTLIVRERHFLGHLTLTFLMSRQIHLSRAQAVRRCATIDNIFKVTLLNILNILMSSLFFDPSGKGSGP
jgi:hypothetical protein